MLFNNSAANTALKPMPGIIGRKGHKPWNKGMKGIDIGGKATRFKKRQPPADLDARWQRSDHKRWLHKNKSSRTK